MDDVKQSAGTSTQRRYNSPLRDQGARETRRRIIDAARDSFLAVGFARTSIADVAAVAGVARPTVLTVFGSKARLLRAVVDIAMAGNDAPVPVAEQPWFQPVWEATSGADCLNAYAHVCSLIGRRSADVIELVRRASDEGDEALQQWETLQANRRLGAVTIARRVRDLGHLAPGLSLARASDLVWMYNDSAHYRALVQDSGWSEKAFERWLSQQLCHTLLASAAAG